MKLPPFRIFAIWLTIGLLLIGGLFSLNLWGKIHSNLPIDAERFSYYGAFIAGIAGFVNFLILTYVYSESKSQSFQTSFFNHLNILTSITKELQSDKQAIANLHIETVALFSNIICEELPKPDYIRGECAIYRAMSPAAGYFEALYRILHIRIRYKDEKPKVFFKDYNWRTGHYFRTFVSVIETIRENHGLDKDKIEFYIRVLKSRSSSDELRLIFYYIISREKEEKIRIAKYFGKEFFDDLKDGFINNAKDKGTYKKIFSQIKPVLPK